MSRTCSLNQEWNLYWIHWNALLLYQIACTSMILQLSVEKCKYANAQLETGEVLLSWILEKKTIYGVCTSLELDRKKVAWRKQYCALYTFKNTIKWIRYPRARIWILFSINSSWLQFRKVFEQKTCFRCFFFLGHFLFVLDGKTFTL